MGRSGVDSSSASDLARLAADLGSNKAIIESWAKYFHGEKRAGMKPIDDLQRIDGCQSGQHCDNCTLAWYSTGRRAEDAGYGEARR
jgi:hypothetical protein